MLFGRTLLGENMSDQNPESTTASTGGLRTPIAAVLGHVDHGKTSLLDQIRGSTVAEGEAGAITQHIGATAVPLSVISDVAGELVKPEDFDLPGLLFIDTPGHHAFTTLRSRGGALADIAVLVVDVNDGFQPQTEEAVDILARSETPFVVAANKIDTVAGWCPVEGAPIQQSYDRQSDRARSRLDDHLYELIGDLSSAGFSADLYWRVQDFQSNIGVVPISAVTGEGVPDLLAVMIGLSQRYMREQMSIDTTGPGVGTVLEVKEERGFGTTVDVVLYDGSLRVGDTIIVGGEPEPIVTDIRALLKPRPLAEIRTEDRFEQVESVAAAAGIKVAAPELTDAVPGAPLQSRKDRSLDAVIGAVQQELAEISVETEEDGIVVKADTLGSLEALAGSLEAEEIPIMRTEVGDIAPRDVTVAGTADAPEHQVILGFNVGVLDEARRQADREETTIFTSSVIYELIDEYGKFVESREQAQQQQVLKNIARPARFRVLNDHVFRQSDPAVVGVEVAGGTLRRNVSVGHLDGEVESLGRVTGIQNQGEDVDEARYGDRVSVAIDGPTVGRDLEEGDELWTVIPEKHAKILEQELTNELPGDEIEVLNRYLEHQRNRDPFWGK